MARCMVLHPNDNVALAVEPVGKGDTVQLSNGQVLVAADPIPFAHKIALFELRPGMEVRKYGEVIGAASVSIPMGAHVHVHNIKSLRIAAQGS